MSSYDHQPDSDWPEPKILQSRIGLGDGKRESGEMLMDLSWWCGSVCAQRAPTFRSSTTTLSWVRRHIHCQPYLFLHGGHRYLVENPALDISHCLSFCWQGLTSSTAVPIPRTVGLEQASMGCRMSRACSRYDFIGRSRTAALLHRLPERQSTSLHHQSKFT